MSGESIGYRAYTAQRAHKRRCYGCDQPIIGGDSVETWSWVETGYPPFRILMHASCNAIANADHLWDDGQERGFLLECCLAEDAAKALDAARSAREGE